jgi:hypothetical protein
MDSSLVLFWNERAVEIFNYHTSPPHDARRMAIIHIAFHNALNTVVEKYQRYNSNETVTGNALFAAATFNSAAKQVLIWAIEDFRKFVKALDDEILGVPHPLKSQIIDGVTYNYNQALDKRIESINIWYNQKKDDYPFDLAHEQLGLQIANAITTSRDNNDNCIPIQFTSLMSDGQGEYKYKGNYFPGAGPYAPFPPPEKKLIVYYQHVKSFVLSNSILQSQNYNHHNTQDIQDVELKGTLAYNSALPPSEKYKVDYWAELKQHTLWNNFTLKLIAATNMVDAWKITRILALVHTAMADGCIYMFKFLYTYYQWRPSTAINEYRGIDPLAYRTDPTSNCWVAYQSGVPRVPEYPSVFGIFGGILKIILNANFRNFGNISLDHSFKENNQTINVQIVYTSIDDAVRDNADTKVNCGWNFKSTITKSFSQGIQIGTYINNHSFKKMP